MALRREGDQGAENDGLVYDDAHNKVANPLERRAVEAQKPDDPDIWRAYSDEMDGYIRAVDDETPLDLVIAGAGITTGIGLGRPREGADAVRAVIATNLMGVLNTIDPAMERARLGKEVGALTGDIARTAGKLANADFVARAPEEVVEENRERLADAEAARAKREAALSRLGAVV